VDAVTHALRALVLGGAALVLGCTAPRARPPAIVELSPHGELVDLEAAVVPGYVTVIDFHAAWCERCVVVDQRLREAVARDPGIVVRRVDIGDGTTPVARAYQIRTLPHVLVIDAGGVLRHRLIGADALTAGELARAVSASAGPRRSPGP